MSKYFLLTKLFSCGRSIQENWWIIRLFENRSVKASSLALSGLKFLMEFQDKNWGIKIAQSDLFFYLQLKLKIFEAVMSVFSKRTSKKIRGNKRQNIVNDTNKHTIINLIFIYFLSSELLIVIERSLNQHLSLQEIRSKIQREIE